MGDTVTLMEYNPEAPTELHRYTNKQQTFKIGFVYPIDENRVVFSLLPLERP